MTPGFSRKFQTPRKGRFSLEPALAGVGAVALVLSWLTTEHFLPWVSWHAEALVFLGVFVVAWFAAVARWRAAPSDRVPVPLIALPFGLFALVALAQLLTGTMMFGGDTVVVWFYAGLCVACLTMGFVCGAVPEAGPPCKPAARWSAVDWLALALVVGTIASVVVAFAQVFDLWENSAWIVRMPDLRRPGGNLAQPNQLATLLVMGIASVAYLHLSRRLTALVAAAVCLFLGAGLAATESRSGVLGLGALLIWWQFKRPAVASGRSRWLAPAAAVVFLGMYLAWPHLLDSLQLLEGRPESRLIQGDLRLAVWRQLLEAAWQRPWWGWGILEVAEAHNSVAHAHAVNNPFSYSHNLVIDWIVWMGLPIALMLTLTCAVWLWRRLRAASNHTTWYCIAVALPLTTHSMLELPFAYAYFLAPVMFLLGVLEASLGVKSVARIGLRPILAALLVISAAMLWSAAEYFTIEEDFRIVRFEQLRIGHTAADHHRPEVLLLTQLGILLTGSRIELRPDMPPAEMEQLKKLALRYPWVATQYRYALALALNGQQQEAIRQFQVIRVQRDEKLYQKIRKEIGDLANSSYPQLRTLALP
jgi:O-antigen ligase